MTPPRRIFIAASKLAVILGLSGRYVAAQIPMDGSPGGAQVSKKEFTIRASPPDISFAS